MSPHRGVLDQIVPLIFLLRLLLGFLHCRCWLGHTCILIQVGPRWTRYPLESRCPPESSHHCRGCSRKGRTLGPSSSWKHKRKIFIFKLERTSEKSYTSSCTENISGSAYQTLPLPHVSFALVLPVLPGAVSEIGLVAVVVWPDVGQLMPSLFDPYLESSFSSHHLD